MVTLATYLKYEYMTKFFTYSLRTTQFSRRFSYNCMIFNINNSINVKDEMEMIEQKTGSIYIILYFHFFCPAAGTKDRCERSKSSKNRMSELNLRRNETSKVMRSTRGGEK